MNTFKVDCPYCKKENDFNEDNWNDELVDDSGDTYVDCMHCEYPMTITTRAVYTLEGSTRLKAGSATKLALNIISTSAFVQLGKVYSNLMIDLRATNAKLTDRALRILIELCPELTRSEAAQRLEDAGENLKAAIVMQRLDVDLDTATGLIGEHQGRLRPILTVKK